MWAVTAGSRKLGSPCRAAQWPSSFMQKRRGLPQCTRSIAKEAAVDAQLKYLGEVRNSSLRKWRRRTTVSRLVAATDISSMIMCRTQDTIRGVLVELHKSMGYNTKRCRAHTHITNLSVL